MTNARTLPWLFETSVERYAGTVMLLEKRGDRYEATTYAEMRERVHRFAAGLLSLGLEKGDRVALISEGRNDWVMAELGILFCGGVNVPLSVKIDELDDLKFRLLHAGCRMAIVSQPQVGKIRAIRNDLPELKLTIVLDTLEALESDELPAAEVLRQGDAFLQDRREALRGAMAVDRGGRLRQHLLHVGHDGGPEGHHPDAPELHRQRRAGRRRDQAAPGLGAAEHPAVGPRLRPHVRHLHDDDERGRARVRPGGPDADGDAQEHPGEHPGNAADDPPQRPGPREELPQEHRKGREGEGRREPRRSSRGLSRRPTRTTRKGGTAGRAGTS